MRIAKLAGVALVLMLSLAACGGGGSAGTEAPSAAPSASADTGGGGAGASDVAIAGFAFVPADISVSAGTTVTWTNNDSAPHTVTLDDGSADSGNMAQGSTFSLAFDTAGTFAYYCAIHASMTGTVTVTP
jgi:plastocyanin